MPWGMVLCRVGCLPGGDTPVGAIPDVQVIRDDHRLAWLAVDARPALDALDLALNRFDRQAQAVGDLCPTQAVTPDELHDL